MIPSWAVASAEDDLCTWTRGEAGLEVNMKCGHNAICCSLQFDSPAWVVIDVSSSDRTDGEGEGGSGIVD